MRPVEEFQRVNDRLVIWQGYDPASKVDLSAHALLTVEGWIFIDPIPLRDEALEELRGADRVAAIVLTNGNHERATAGFKKSSDAPVFAHAAAQPVLSIEADHWIEDGGQVCGLSAIHLPGFVPGEMALHDAAAGGLMMMGDALINLESTSFSLLPDKYCDAPKVARKSVEKLLQFPFELMTFAHGLPIIAGASRRLQQLLQ